MKVERRRHLLDGGWNAPLPATPGEVLVLVFGAPAYRDHPQAFEELSEAFPNGVIAGCSTSGEIHQLEVFDASLSVAVVSFDRTRIRKAGVDVVGTSEEAGAALAEQLAGEELKHVLVLSDGMVVNGTELVRGLNEALEGVLITGGLAGDGADFGSTWVLSEGRPVSKRVTAIGFYGDLIVGHGSRGGWDPFGIERTVTRSEGNQLFELDNRPALALYKEYLGERSSELPASGLLFPLTLKNEAEGADLVRTILAVDEETQSLTFAGDIPPGARVQLMKANFDRLVDGAEGAALACDAEEPVFVVAVSCVGRRLVLADRVEEEIEATLEAFPEGSSMVGFYSYGELSPVASGTCELHNQTMTLTTYREP